MHHNENQDIFVNNPHTLCTLYTYRSSPPLRIAPYPCHSHWVLALVVSPSLLHTNSTKTRHTGLPCKNIHYSHLPFTPSTSNTTPCRPYVLSSRTCSFPVPAPYEWYQKRHTGLQCKRVHYSHLPFIPSTSNSTPCRPFALSSRTCSFPAPAPYEWYQKRHTGLQCKSIHYSHLPFTPSTSKTTLSIPFALSSRTCSFPVPVPYEWYQNETHCTSM